MKNISFAIIFLLAAMSGGCNSFDAPLILGRVDELGLHASATAPDQGASASIGFRTAKVAVVPVSHDGRPLLATNTTPDAAAPGPVAGADAFSTFTHFGASTGVALAQGPSACLDDTLATGVAAQRLASNLPKFC